MRRGIGRLRAGGSAFDPISLFGASDRGVVNDFTTASKLFQSSAGSTAVTTAADPIGYVTDSGPQGKHAVQATAANRPLWLGMPRTLGTEAATNGRFASDTVWTKGTGWTIAGAKATKTAGTASTISQTITLTAGTVYAVFFSMTRTAGTMAVTFTGGTTVTGLTRNTSSSNFDYLVAATGNTTLAFSADAAFAGTLSNVSVKPVTSWTDMAAFFDGSNDKLVTPSVDLSASDKATVVMSYYTGPTVGGWVQLDIGSVYAPTNGSFSIDSGPGPQGSLQGDTARASLRVPNAEAEFAGVINQFVASFQIDLAPTTIATEINVRTRGIAPTTPVTSGSTAGGGNLVNGAITIGSGAAAFNWRGWVKRLLVINRTLTSGELTSAERWAKQGAAYCAVVGDSTSAENTIPDGIASECPTTISFAGGMVCGAADISMVGDKIADQKTKWTALDQKGALEVVIVQVGLNDINNYIKTNTKTITQIIADLQDLITTIRADVPSSCKIYVSQMTPAKAWLGLGSGREAQCYQAWLDMNDAIAGNGATPITGVDGRITAHVALLNDGSGNLQTIYDHNGDGVHPSAEGKFVIAQVWRDTLLAAGLVS